MYNSDIKHIVKSVHQIMFKGGYSNIVIHQTIKKNSLDSQTAAHHRKTVYGVVENYIYLEEILNRFVKKNIKRDLQLFLMTGLFELLFLSGRSNHAVVNRFVDTAKVDYKGSEKFVNAILRRALREPISFDDPKHASALALKYSYPKWLIHHWLDTFGFEITHRMLNYNQNAAPLYLRTNPQVNSRESLMEALVAIGLEVEIEPRVSGAIKVVKLNNVPLFDTDLFKNGHFSVQDLSAMLVAEVCGVNEGQNVLDLCAAPGGKTCDFAERVGENGSVTACDVHDHKIKLIDEAAKRLRLDHVDAKLNDGKVINDAWVNSFDIVVVDAPCSGLGTIIKNPEIKYRKNLQDIVKLSEVQKQILNTARHYVKDGGKLVYATCTIEPLENNLQVDNFLNENKMFKRAASDLQILPDGTWSDGFYIAVMTKQQ